MSTVIGTKKVKIEIVEIRLIPVTIRNSIGRNIVQPGWKGYAYAEPFTEYCPCCNQPKKPVHAGKEMLTITGAALVMEKYRDESN